MSTTIIDEYSCQYLPVGVVGSIRSRRVINVLGRLVSLCGTPHATSGRTITAVCPCAVAGRDAAARIDVVKPWRNDANKSFDGVVSITTRGEIVMETWCQRYSNERPH